MKKILILSVLFSWIESPAQIISIPDAAFKNKLTHGYPNNHGYDTNLDGEIDMTEAAAITAITIHSSIYHDLTGIRNFVNLQTLNADNCSIAAFDLHDMVNLKTFSCVYNYNLTTTIDVSGCVNLTSFSCNTNPVTSINLAGAHAIKTFSAHYNTLQHLDLSGQTQLTSVDVSEGQLLTIDLTGVTTLQNFQAFNNHLISLSLPNNPELDYVECSYNQLTTLDLTGDTALRTLRCNSNQLENIALDGTVNVKHLTCIKNNLKSLDVKHMKVIRDLDCSFNALESLDISDWLDIDTYRTVDCSHNQLKSFVLKNSTISHLECGDNYFESLDLSWHSMLISFKCPNVPTLGYINISNNNNSPLLSRPDYGDIDLTNNYNLFYICADGFQIGKFEDYLQHIGLNTKVGDDCSIDPVINPNPAKDFVTVNGLEKISSIELFDLQGHLLQTRQGTGQFREYIDLTPYVTGFYIVKVKTETGNGNTTKKIIKI